MSFRTLLKTSALLLVLSCGIALWLWPKNETVSEYQFASVNAHVETRHVTIVCQEDNPLIDCLSIRSDDAALELAQEICQKHGGTHKFCNFSFDKLSEHRNFFLKTLGQDALTSLELVKLCIYQPILGIENERGRKDILELETLALELDNGSIISEIYDLTQVWLSTKHDHLVLTRSKRPHSEKPCTRQDDELLRNAILGW